MEQQQTKLQVHKKNGTRNMSDNPSISELPLSADKIPQLVAYITPRS